jgi:hypothetical protein
MRRRSIASVAAMLMTSLFGALGAYAAEPTLVTILEFPGNSTDLTKIKKGETPTPNVNRNGFFSDLFYDAWRKEWYALSDRGPGGGLISYGTRVQKFTFTYNSKGAISGYKLIKTIPFKRGNAPYNGLNPTLLNGDPSVLGLSFDPEGLVVGWGGRMYVSDEYGPSVYEFTSTGHFIRAFRPPANLLPRVNGTLDFTADPPTTGRQGNRGYEGLAINRLGTKLYAILQDPLQEEGAETPNPGRRSRNVRIVEYNVLTGKSARQFVYQLDTIAEINARNPAEAPFGATAQGRNIGASSIYGLSSTEFLVLERDNRGRGVDNPFGVDPGPLHKRIYKIDISGATDVSNISLAGTNDALPAGVVPVQKTLFLDLLTAIEGAGHWQPEKIEGLPSDLDSQVENGCSSRAPTTITA